MASLRSPRRISFPSCWVMLSPGAAHTGASLRQRTASLPLQEPLAERHPLHKYGPACRLSDCRARTQLTFEYLAVSIKLQAPWSGWWLRDCGGSTNRPSGGVAKSFTAPLSRSQLLVGWSVARVGYPGRHVPPKGNGNGERHAWAEPPRHGSHATGASPNCRDSHSRHASLQSGHPDVCVEVLQLHPYASA
eukprot:scaffold1041_cov414-Prasinococcus_capsulatus_cf.AAC.6